MARRWRDLFGLRLAGRKVKGQSERGVVSGLFPLRPSYPRSSSCIRSRRHCARFLPDGRLRRLSNAAGTIDQAIRRQAKLHFSDDGTTSRPAQRRATRTLISCGGLLVYQKLLASFGFYFQLVVCLIDLIAIRWLKYRDLKSNCDNESTGTSAANHDTVHCGSRDRHRWPGQEHR